jgi:hypothetical protein
VAAGGLGTFIVHCCGTPLTIIASVYDPATQASFGAWIVTLVVSHREYKSVQEWLARLHATLIATETSRNKPHEVLHGGRPLQLQAMVMLTLFHGRGNRSKREVGVMRGINGRTGSARSRSSLAGDRGSDPRSLGRQPPPS